MTRVGFFLIVLAGACSVQTNVELYSDDKDPPIRMAPVGATSKQFIGVFGVLCLENFPDQSAMKATAAKFGFRKIDHLKTGVVGEAIDLEIHESKSLKLSAQFGENLWFGMA